MGFWHCCGFLALVLGCASSAAPVEPPMLHRTEIAASRPDDPERWRGFEHRSELELLALGHDLAGCSTSAVNGEPACASDRFMVASAWIELHRIVDDDRYRRAADAAVRMLPRVSEEPFATGWLLRVAMDERAAMLRPDLVDAADVAARRELARLQQMDDHALARAILFGTADNASWALLAVERWAEHRRDAELGGQARALVETRWLDASVERWCPLAVDRLPEPGEFVSPCLSRSGAVVPVMEPLRATGWVRRFVGVEAMLEAQQVSAWPSEPALNFTRAMMLWELHRATGSLELRDAYVAHVEAGLAELSARREAGASIPPRLAGWAVHAIAASR